MATIDGEKIDAARNACSTSGTGALTLGDNITGAQSIKARMTSGKKSKFYFRKGSQWISFEGTFTSPDQLARTRIIDGSGGLATNVDFAVGSGEVACDVPAEELDTLNLIEASVTSAGTTDIGAAAALRIAISGTTGPITSFGTSANKLRIVRHSGSTITHNATSLILKGGVNRTTVANDIGIYASDTSGNWRELDYEDASGKAIRGNATVSGTLAVAGAASAPNFAATGAPGSVRNFDGSGSMITVANGASGAIVAGSGLLVLTDTNVTGQSAVYLVGGSSGTLIAGGSIYVASTTTPAAGKVSVQYDGVTGYKIYNAQGSSITFGVAFLTSRATI
jgi:hypothetical protein